MNKQEYYCWVSENSLGNKISEDDACKIVADCKSRGIKVIDIESADYPDSLRFIDDPPKILYCMGDINLLNDKNKIYVAVVGTRRSSPYGKWVTNEIGKVLSRYDAIHVSGMAEGIDAAGHRAVIGSEGKSIAVLGTGIDICFPKSSGDIYNSLQTKGLIITEYAPGTSGRPVFFPRRNRIISGLSSKVVIVEGILKSGSMITAHLAMEQGKEVYAIPGNINQPNSIGPNRLIEDGAIPIVDPACIAESLGVGIAKEQISVQNLCGIYAKIYEIVNISGSIRVEDVINVINDSPENIMAAITVLELKSLISNEFGILRTC